MLTILAGVAEFEREIIRERTLAGVRAARAAGKVLGRPRRVFRRDEAVRMRVEGQSWRAIAKAMDLPVSTVRGGVNDVPCQSLQEIFRGASTRQSLHRFHAAIAALRGATARPLSGLDFDELLKKSLGPPES